MRRRSKTRSVERTIEQKSLIRPAPRARPLGQLRTINELADLWDVSPRTVQRLTKSGALRIRRIGRLVRISDADAAAFLDENRDD